MAGGGMLHGLMGDGRPWSYLEYVVTASPVLTNRKSLIR